MTEISKASLTQTQPEQTQLTVTGSQPNGVIVGSRVLLDGIAHIMVRTENNGCVFHIEAYNESINLNSLHLDFDCTTAKKTKRKGTRFKPTITDRLEQAKNSKYGRH